MLNSAWPEMAILQHQLRRKCMASAFLRQWRIPKHENQEPLFQDSRHWASPEPASAGGAIFCRRSVFRVYIVSAVFYLVYTVYCGMAQRETAPLEPAVAPQ